MFLDFLFEVFRANARAEAVIWRDQSFSYGELLTRTEHWRSYLQKNDVTNGTVVAIDADFRVRGFEFLDDLYSSPDKLGPIDLRVILCYKPSLVY